jgi:hypothetical protein
MDLPVGYLRGGCLFVFFAHCDQNVAILMDWASLVIGLAVLQCYGFLAYPAVHDKLS